MRKLIVIVMLLAAGSLQASETPYQVKRIPEDLLKKADAVKRMEDVRFEVVSLKETILTRRYAITILNEGGDAHAAFREYYDKLRTVRSAQGTLYDAAGNPIKKVKFKDMSDTKVTDGMSMLDDSRVKSHNFYHRIYPYTVEYEVEIRHSHTFYLDSWAPQDAVNLSVEQSRYVVVSPVGYEVRYKSFNCKETIDASPEKGKKVIEWKVTALPAFTYPFAAPVWAELTPVVKLAPSEFAIDNYRGNMSQWGDMAKFLAELNKGRDKLPDDIVQKAKAIIAPLQTDEEKVKALYVFMQKNTRYISIQLGIGGWQPFEASFIAQKGYGDCKGLSNYMFSLLKAVGIRSHYAIIRAGRSKEDRFIIEDFPSNQSNHVVLCVPLQKDTLWLECTSQTDPAGYMGGFTGNRKALLVTEDGGALVSTPRYKLEDNLQIRTIRGKIDGNGNLLAKIQTAYTGIQQDRLQGMVQALSDQKIKEHLNENLNFSTYSINGFKYDLKKDMLPVLNEDLDLTVSNFSTVSGRRIFITPNLLSHSSVKISEEDKDRKYDYIFDIEYRDVDSVELELPEGYKLETAPPEVNLKTGFGSYRTIVKMQDNKLLFVRVLEQYAGRFPPSMYKEIADFYAAIYKADRARVVLVKKEG